MRRIIPGKIEIKIKMFGNITIFDLLILAIGLVMSGLIAFTTMPSYAKLPLIAVIISLSAICVIDINTKKGYNFLIEGFAFILRKKKNKAINLEQNKNFEATKFLKVNGSYTAVVELNGLDFSILEEDHQDSIISTLQGVLEDYKEASFIKLDKKVDYTRYIQNLEKYRKHIEETYKEGKAKETRLNVLDIHSDYIKAYNQSEVTTDCYFIAIKEDKVSVLEEVVTTLTNVLDSLKLDSKLLQEDELVKFINCFFQKEGAFTPILKEGYSTITVDGVEKQIISIGRYPFYLTNAWASDLFAIEGVTAVFNFKKYGGKNLEKNMHNAIREIGSNIISERSETNQKRSIGQAQILDELINDVVFRGEEIYDTQLYIMFDKTKAKEIIKIIKHCKVRIDLCLGLQKEAYLAMLPYSRINSQNKRYNLVQMPGKSVAGAFPFINRKIEDKEGLYLGYNRNSIFFDLFQRDEQRVNSNMVILGQSGQGKSFVMKKLLLETACKDAKIFVLDPEDEYHYLADEIEGNYLDVAGARKNKINPLQIFPSLSDDDDAERGDDITLHRVFLEQFIKIVCPSMPNDCSMYLNNLIGQLYDNFNITASTNLQTLKNNEYPTFDDLLKLIRETLKDERLVDYEKRTFNSLAMYIEQFANKGVYSNMWNGYTTLELNNKFNVLNFRNLLSNNNRLVANAQMLLVMRYLNLEIIKNKAYNDNNCKKENFKKQHCVIFIDEAHNFIDTKFTTALDFMKNMSKQIRKYDGAFLLATQNISDFVGQSEEIRSKATAVIDNCKLALIFSLQPNDMNNIIDLYKSSRPFTEREKEILRAGKRGEALFKISNDVRVFIKIQAFDEEINYFEQRA